MSQSQNKNTRHTWLAKLIAACVVAPAALVTVLIVLLVGSNPAVMQAAENTLSANSIPKAHARTLPVKKDVFHRFEKLRSGQIKTERGYNVTDFGVSMYNPNTKPLTVTWKLIADDPDFTYTGGAKGTWSKTFDLQPDDGITDNVYCGCYPHGAASGWPVPVEANWTGAIEFSAAEPFYAYVLWINDIEGPKGMPAVRKSWLLWSGQVQMNWDKERNQFVSPYSNFWWNEPSYWLGGWYTRLILTNRGTQSVTYRINHKSYHYGERFSNGATPFTVRFGTDTADITLNPGATADLRLEKVFGWDQPGFSVKMEGRLLVTPTPLTAADTTDIKLFILPGKATLPNLQEQEREVLAESAGIIVNDSLMAALMAVPVPAEDTGSSQMNLFAQTYKGQRTDFTGNVGFEFTPAAPLSVTALGRSINGGTLQRPHPVTLWDSLTEKPLAHVSVSPASKVDEQGFGFERLPAPVKLEQGRSYRITSGEEAGGDPMMDIGDIRAHRAVADVGPGVFAVGDAYPKQKFGRDEQGYGLPTLYFDTTGVAPALLKTGPRAPAPFLRELTTGYLLNCSFMSPRPYCWQGADCRLSGWEVDRSGGNMAFQPTCLYPDGFAFHSDWFKLVDTSANAAVTLNHQIARQTNGQLTLEFRFKLPARMDGARWQLRDLGQAGVSLITVDDNLCVESSEGKPVVLARIENGREYGVKVVADITTKTADVFVDGELKAQAASFAHPVSTIDFFLVKTGDAATGEMFINPVNIFKGYAVNETFVTCGTGKLPAGWTIDHVGRTVSVEAFECGTKPDIFSLKLAATAERRAATWRSFPPTQGKTVFEYRFLLPEKRDGAAAEIYGGKNGVRIATLGGDLCLFDEKTQPVPLVRHYRTNLWYMVKVIADPGAGTADVFVNGKSVARQVKFLSGLKAFNAVRFDTERGTVMWVDDVQVYPWCDYPADYVPEPKPVAVKNGVLLGAQSCNLWREGTAYAGWDYVYPYRDKRKPYLGWYDEGHPEETDWEIKWQVEHGIGFEQHCWYRPNNAINHPIKDGVLDQGLIKGLFNARYSHLKKFTIMCTNEGACETNPQDWRENIIPYWIEYFFKDPRYLTLDGKPVLSIYHLGHLQRMFGGADGARQAIQTLRDEVSKAGLPGIIVLMEERTANPATLKAMKAIGVDACYAYTWGTPDSMVQRKQNAAQRDAAAAVGFLSLPSISMGWDREAWGVKEGGWLPVADYRALAQWTRDEFMTTLPADSLGRRIVMLANWNEFGEGHFLMPSTLAGFGYVDALREVFTEGGAHEDLVPTDAQKRRFTVLYPRE